MSMPTFSETDLTRDEAINQIISSIAMEELALSHVINAEGEKLQYILGTIPGSTAPQATIEQVLEVNESVKGVLQAAADNQTILRSKLQAAISSAVLYGPPGPEGPQGPSTIEVNPVVIRLAADEEPYVVNNGTDDHLNLQFAIPAGEAGPVGPMGRAATVAVEPAQRVPFSDEPTVTNIGTDTDAVFVFGIPQGEPGERGPAGPAAETIAAVPFSVGKYGAILGCDTEGNPSQIAFSGFAPTYYSGTYLDEGEWESGVISINGTKQLGALFIMPYNATLKTIHVMFANTYAKEFTNLTALRPFVCLATSQTSTMDFTILQNTMTYTEPFLSGNCPAYTVKRGTLSNIDTSIPEGTMVAIVAGFFADGSVDSQQCEFVISGGMLLG